jgi:Fe-S cluster assembly protein SufB
MSKYTEDDLKSNSKLKNKYGFYTELEADTFPMGTKILFVPYP